MPNHIDHIKQAKHNTVCANKFLTGSQDWSITAAFYAAVHYVEAAFDLLDNIHSKDHPARETEIQLRFSRKCQRHYLNLRDASRRARYLDNSPGIATSYYSSQEVSEFIKIDLANVKAELEKLKINLS